MIYWRVIMNKKTYILLNIISNSVIFILMVTAFIMMFFFAQSEALAGSGWNALKYFTVLSNIYMGLISLISIIFIVMKKDSKILSIIKLTSTTSVTLTFMTVMAYLGPIYGYGLMFEGANLFMHLIIPVLAILHWLFLEPKRDDLKFIYSIYSIVPMILYGIVYLSNITYHGGYGNKNYDWYFFAAKGLGLGLVMFLIMIIVTYVFSIALYFGYKKINLISKNVSD